MNKHAKRILTIFTVCSLTAFGVWYLVGIGEGVNPIYKAIMNIGESEISEFISSCLSFAMIALSVCCINSLLILPELLTQKRSSTFRWTFLISRAVLALTTCILLALNVVKTGETLIGRILLVLLAILLTAYFFAPTIFFIIDVFNGKNNASAIKSFSLASLVVVLFALLFLPALAILFLYVALKVIGFLFKIVPDYNGNTQSSNASVECYVTVDGVKKRLTRDCANPNIWYDTSGEKYLSENDGRTFTKL